VSEVYVSECCGAVFVPGHGPDNLHDAEQGVRLVLERRTEDSPVFAHGCEIASRSEEWQRVHRVTSTEETLYDAMRAGDCPCCGDSVPGLHLLLEVPEEFTRFMPAAQGGGRGD